MADTTSTRYLVDPLYYRQQNTPIPFAGQAVEGASTQAADVPRKPVEWASLPPQVQEVFQKLQQGTQPAVQQDTVVSKEDSQNAASTIQAMRVKQSQLGAQQATAL